MHGRAIVTVQHAKRKGFRCVGTTFLRGDLAAVAET